MAGDGMRERLDRELHRVLRYLDPDLQDRARACIPVDELHAAAHARVAEVNAGDSAEAATATSFEEELVRALLKWFKNDFFVWVNAPPCDHCTNGTSCMRLLTVEAGAPEDELFMAGRVEVYICETADGLKGCRASTRFPRYNDPGKLLETRRGRCGEWANCFCLMTHTLGLPTRFVIDYTDHVWTEVFIARTSRWTHADSCEAAFDTPLLYERGWGKELSHIFAFDAESAEVVDVFLRYSRSDEALAKRAAKVDLDWLHGLCAELTAQCQTERGLSDELKSVILSRRIEEEELLEEQFWEDFSGNESSVEEKLPGRQSGSLDWRTARGECGVASLAPDVITYDPTSDPLTETLATVASASDLHHVGSSSASSFLGFLPPSFASPTSCAMLTPCANDACGAAYLQGLTLNFNPDGSIIVKRQAGENQIEEKRFRTLVVQFTFRITSELGLPAIGGADGLAFVIQNDSLDAIGTGGSGLGYSTLHHALAVEFDTHKSDSAQDVNDNHIAVMASPYGYKTRVSSSHNVVGSNQFGCVHQNLPNFNDGRFYTARIIVERRRVVVELTDDPDASKGVSSFVRVLEARLDMRDVLKRVSNEDNGGGGGDDQDTGFGAWMGFTAATGGLCQAHQVGLVRVWGMHYAPDHPRANPK